MEGSGGRGMFGIDGGGSDKVSGSASRARFAGAAGHRGGGGMSFACEPAAAFRVSSHCCNCSLAICN